MAEVVARPTSDDEQQSGRGRDVKALRALLKDLLLHDPEILDVLRKMTPPEIHPEPDAALGQWVQTLIEGKLKQYVRQDALRRPLP
jgi:hypothetical protein